MNRWMWIIAGPNGAGKSTFAGRFLDNLNRRRGQPLVKLNADERTLSLRAQFPDAAQNDLNLRAAIAIDAEVEDHIRAGRSFAVETVLSSPKYRDDVLAAKASGFKFGLIYVSLYPPELSPQRVSERAAKGGHDVLAERADCPTPPISRRVEVVRAASGYADDLRRDQRQTERPYLSLAVSGGGQSNAFIPDLTLLWTPHSTWHFRSGAHRSTVQNPDKVPNGYAVHPIGTVGQGRGAGTPFGLWGVGRRDA